MIFMMNVVHDRVRATEALDRLIEVTLLLGDDMARALAAHGLTVARTQLLWALNGQGASTQRALSDALNVTPRNITGLVDGLVASGHVSREPHPTDRRATLVTLTPPGAALMEDMAAEHEALAAQLFGDLSPEQLGGLLAGLGVVTGRLLEALEGEHS